MKLFAGQDEGMSRVAVSVDRVRFWEGRGLGVMVEKGSLGVSIARCLPAALTDGTGPPKMAPVMEAFWVWRFIDAVGLANSLLFHV